jgi:hypothetical protein
VKLFIKQNAGSISEYSNFGKVSFVLTYYQLKIPTFFFSHTKKSKNVGHKVFRCKKNDENVDQNASSDLIYLKFPEITELHDIASVVN